MRSFITFCVLFLVVRNSLEYCHQELQPNRNSCLTTNGTTLAVGDSITIQSKCEHCSCDKSPSMGDNVLMYSCCGFGIHGGVFAAPPGCAVIAGKDGCSIQMVSASDHTKDCLQLIPPTE